MLPVACEGLDPAAALALEHCQNELDVTEGIPCLGLPAKLGSWLRARCSGPSEHRSDAFIQRSNCLRGFRQQEHLRFQPFAHTQLLPKPWCSVSHKLGHERVETGKWEPPFQGSLVFMGSLLCRSTWKTLKKACLCC